MSEIALSAQHLSKQYRLGQRLAQYSTVRDSLAAAFARPYQLLKGRRSPRTADNTFWALQNVSFQVTQGEVVGIIGRNGAGKSTLLKILSRITQPTDGYVDIYGRVGSLLEVGTGFHPELTGRENIYLSGAILGMHRTEIQAKLEEIIAFAEIEKFLDTPVKFYSSGMYVRLAFAVAAHLEPEVLILDEVLAVGDAQFQKKCLGKIGDVAKAGRTVLFVSHNMIALQNLCSRAIQLQEGRVVADGPAIQVVQKYLSTAYVPTAEQVWPDPAAAPGTEGVRLRRVAVRATDKETADFITIHTPLTLEFEFWNLVPGAYLNLSVVVLNEEGMALFNTVPLHESVWHGKPFPVGLFRSSCVIPGDLLNDGTHRVQLLIVKDQSVVIFQQDDALVFEVHDDAELRTGWYGKWLGAVRPALTWRTEQLAGGVE